MVHGAKQVNFAFHYFDNFPEIPSIFHLTVPGDGPQRSAVRFDADGRDADQNRHAKRDASMFVLHLHGPN